MDVSLSLDPDSTNVRPYKRDKLALLQNVDTYLCFLHVTFNVEFVIDLCRSKGKPTSDLVSFNKSRVYILWFNMRPMWDLTISIPRKWWSLPRSFRSNSTESLFRWNHHLSYQENKLFPFHVQVSYLISRWCLYSISMIVKIFSLRFHDTLIFWNRLLYLMNSIFPFCQLTDPDIFFFMIVHLFEDYPYFFGCIFSKKRVKISLDIFMIHIFAWLSLTTRYFTIEVRNSITLYQLLWMLTIWEC